MKISLVVEVKDRAFPWEEVLRRMEEFIRDRLDFLGREDVPTEVYIKIEV